jgi:hypothetical protein
MNTPVLHRTGFSARLGIVLICLSICYFAATAAFGADAISLSGLSGSNGFVFAGIAADEIDWDPAGGPHGGYQTTSQKCVTCHSAHGAAGSDVTGNPGTNTAINRSSTGCAFCHILGAPAAPNGTPAGFNPATTNVLVYKATGGLTDAAAFATEEASGHSLGEHPGGIPGSTIAHTVVLSCSTCHLVHGSTVTAWKPDDFYGAVSNPTSVTGYKFLRDNPSGNLRATTDPLRNDTVPNTVGEALAAGIELEELNQFTLSVWCANCHDKTLQPEHLEHKNGVNWLGYFVSSGAGSSIAHLADPSSSTALSDVTEDGMGHRSNLFDVATGANDCYTCHRAGLTVKGEIEDYATSLTLPFKYQDTFQYQMYAYQGNIDNHYPAQCSRCHYGTANYAIDKNRVGTNQTADFPHSSANDRKLMGDFTLDASDPYDPNAVTTSLDWSQLAMTDNGLRTAYCGRCHIPNDSGLSGGFENGPWVEFFISEHEMAHLVPSGWMLNPILGGDLYSPGVGTP